MTRKKRRYILSLRHYNRHLNKYGSVKCIQCGKQLEVDEDVVSRGTYGRTKVYKNILYCIPCARDLYFVED